MIHRWTSFVGCWWRSAAQHARSAWNGSGGQAERSSLLRIWRASLEDYHSSPVVEDGEVAREPGTRSHKRRFLDYLLLVIEVAAVVGFIFILFNGINLIQELNQEVAAALEQPTLTPTPLIVAVVLPSGHTPPNAEGGTRPNDAEIPDHLRPLVQSLANIPVPTPGPEQAIRSPDPGDQRGCTCRAG